MSPKILIADDDSDNRTIAKEILEISGYQVVEARNGLEVMELVESELPDILLLDLSMPKLDGWEVARQLRSSEKTAHLPIIAFTAHAITGDELKAKAAGCDDYLSKPCMPAAVLQKVQRWLERPPGEGAAAGG